jgi:NAD(P)-dependent dehydrogenase (short-subunit alcohol dehydrogenase family)
MNSVLITGASSGIGRQLAIDYAKAGYQVIACGRNSQRLRSLTHDRPQISTLTFDVSDKVAVRNHLGSLPEIPKLIILNAGDCEYLNHGHIDSELCQRVFASNFFGVINILDEIQQRLQAGTQIGVMSSAATFLPLPRAEAYGASKAALRYFCQSLALEWRRRGIGFSIISPGFVKTPLTDRNDFDMPMLIDAEQASKIIRKGLAKAKTEIEFPRLFTRLLHSIALLPSRWQIPLVVKATGGKA